MGLGRGLSSLISTPHLSVIEKKGAEKNLAEVLPNLPEQSPSSAVATLAIELIHPNPEQPRKRFSTAEIKELSDSIKSVGIIQPLIVRRSPNLPDGQFEIVAGERRWRAAKAAELSHLPVIIRDFEETRALEIALIENVQRENLNPVEEALGYKRLQDEFSLTQVEISERVGKERATVANLLRLLTLPEPVLELLREGKLSAGHAKTILAVKEPSAQISLAKKTVHEALSVRALESIVSRVVILDGGKRTPTERPTTQSSAAQSAAVYFESLERLKRTLGTKVALKHHRSGKGKIEIDYYSEQELERLIEQLTRP
ncbi:MAG: ParB/RepB/Spo0J family partition protein [Oligoflexia bacterium]|nr:ParB/RepB/Spo0J family partition protein [Oligoflexia bacterium]